MGKIIWILISLLAGSFIAVQGGLNAMVGKELKSPIHASLFSFIIGAILIGLYIVVTRQAVSLDGVKNVPWYGWFRKKNGVIIFTGGGLALYPHPLFTPLSIDKAALRALAFLLNKELAPQGIFVGTVTIAGAIEPDTHFAPELIAQNTGICISKDKNVK
jgi:NAD(P)-dependent dehydrogenase (short-subunit alcohol dehydrogenase family)